MTRARVGLAAGIPLAVGSIALLASALVIPASAARAEGPRIVELPPVSAPPSEAGPSARDGTSESEPGETRAEPGWTDRSALNAEPAEEVSLEPITPATERARERGSDAESRPRAERTDPSAAETRAMERDRRLQRRRIQDRLRRVMALGRTRK